MPPKKGADSSARRRVAAPHSKKPVKASAVAETGSAVSADEKDAVPIASPPAQTSRAATARRRTTTKKANASSTLAIVDAENTKEDVCPELPKPPQQSQEDNALASDQAEAEVEAEDSMTLTAAPLHRRVDEPQDEILWSDTDEDDGKSTGTGHTHKEEKVDVDDDDDEIILFPDAESLQFGAAGHATHSSSHDHDERRVIQLGTTQQLDESDSSDEEAVLNRVGDIPLEWYKDEDHMGYDVEGRKLMKSEQSALDKLLAATDDANAMRTIYDALHNESKVLSNADLQVIFNLQRNRTTNAQYNMYAEVQQDSVELDPLNHPLARGSGPSRAHFTPSLHDMKVVAKMVRRLRRARAEAAARHREEADTKDTDTDTAAMTLWDDGHVEMDTHTHFKYFNRVAKPKAPPPGTYESYRPPPEYLPSEKAKQRQSRLRAVDRKEHFLPCAFDALRHVPFYNHTIQDRYQRCLDLAFFPRAQRTRLVVDPNRLLPDLPDPKDLRPYPERLSFQYKGHTATVRSITVSPNGQYLATACDDHVVRVYEVGNGRLAKRYDLGAPVSQVEFCPVSSLNLLAAAVGYSVVFMVPTFVAHAVVNDYTVRYLRAPGLSAGRAATSSSSSLSVSPAAAAAAVPAMLGAVDTMYGRAVRQTTMDTDEVAHVPVSDLHDTEEREKRAEFVDATLGERQAGIVVKVALHARVTRFTFHARGDYLCVLCPKDHVKYRQTVMLQLSKRKVFCPFRKFAEVVMDCKFHPREPLFFLATTNAVRCYNLMAHKLQRRYKAPGGVTTCLSIHPEGDNFLIGDTTSHTAWYDCDFSDKPYKRMRSHKAVVNAVSFHPNTNAYPLFATGAADGQVHVFHGMVYDDYNKNALIVPVKILKHRRPVYAVAWHPTLPWVFTGTEDGVVTVWTE